MTCCQGDSIIDCVTMVTVFGRHDPGVTVSLHGLQYGHECVQRQDVCGKQAGHRKRILKPVKTDEPTAREEIY